MSDFVVFVLLLLPEFQFTNTRICFALTINEFVIFSLFFSHINSLYSLDRTELRKEEKKKNWNKLKIQQQKKSIPIDKLIVCVCVRYGFQNRNEKFGSFSKRKSIYQFHFGQ